MNKYKFIGIVLHIIYRILSFMTKKEYYYADNVDIEVQKIMVFWHRKIFTVCNATRTIKKKASMVSSSKDGEILSELLRREGNEIIRGSSNKDNIKSLKESMKFVKKGYSLGIAIDGPKGPIFEPKAGAIYIAQKTGLPIIPVSSFCSKRWIFRNVWDRLEIPKPFSRNVHYIGEPFYISKDISIEEATEIVKENIHKAGRKAYEIYRNKYILKK
ncbi:MAG: lysophospholipid acyltransferase family protein [Pseudoleptotrichia goodfellowii]|nr:lysophospholipid acyltransferase family protein [Pseudoleptotrichia goodfellowii]